MQTYHKTLTIAGSDSGGGAGIQADLKTFSALGCYGMSVITALTAQNTIGVSAIHPVPPEFIEKQLRAVLSDIGADAIKIGMLHSAEVIRTVAACLQEFEVSNIVLDPVMVATSGDRLLRDDAVDALKEYLIPMATVITPNIPEAEVLLGLQPKVVDTLAEMHRAAYQLTLLGSQSVLLKGGHLTGKEQGTDVFIVAETEQVQTFTGEQVDTLNTHGTGCTLSAAIAAFLARGLDLSEAIRQAKAYLQAALLAGKDYQLGQGHGPVYHFAVNREQ
jgi:hydroxymethylpyrimidine/phosphomethylpyrimidine kinase